SLWVAFGCLIGAIAIEEDVGTTRLLEEKATTTTTTTTTSPTTVTEPFTSTPSTTITTTTTSTTIPSSTTTSSTSAVPILARANPISSSSTVRSILSTASGTSGTTAKPSAKRQISLKLVRRYNERTSQIPIVLYDVTECSNSSTGPAERLSDTTEKSTELSTIVTATVSNGTETTTRATTTTTERTTTTTTLETTTTTSTTAVPPSSTRKLRTNLRLGSTAPRVPFGGPTGPAQPYPYDDSYRAGPVPQRQPIEPMDFLAPAKLPQYPSFPERIPTRISPPQEQFPALKLQTSPPESAPIAPPKKDALTVFLERRKLNRNGPYTVAVPAKLTTPPTTTVARAEAVTPPSVESLFTFGAKPVSYAIPTTVKPSLGVVRNGWDANDFSFIRIEKVSYLLQYGPGVHTVFEQQDTSDKPVVDTKDRVAPTTTTPSTLTSKQTSESSLGSKASSTTNSGSFESSTVSHVNTGELHPTTGVIESVQTDASPLQTR
ncbi:AGAP006500-PA, partial [Anopheles gambiae str. PEST]